MRSIRTMAFVMAAVVSASSYATTKKKQEIFSADSQMEYCVGKVKTALSQLRDGEGKYDYTMMPRNILDGKTWNCRKAKPEEWCSGFWPGVLWMAYKASGDGEIRQAAEGYTKALDFVATRPAYDHDLGFITINSWLKGIEALGDKAPQHYRRTALAAADSLFLLLRQGRKRIIIRSGNPCLVFCVKMSQIYKKWALKIWMYGKRIVSLQKINTL